ncbi:liver-expressed antimicrobial peptide 2 [Eucyclogobius newberryi]|uniref:liver-expressed antimicrobial peptide 2 n=1 Tax=Eucyclogobius newberryi TaxID=166745 RepID=UPI003B5AB24C
MATFQHSVVVLSIIMVLISAVQVNSLPVPEDWTGVILRTKRSLLWRWNSLKAVGTSCRDHSECGTQFCRKNICSFWRTP